MTRAMNISYHHAHILEMAKERLLIEEFLVKKSDLTIRDTEGRNSLFWAIKHKSRYNIQILLKYNISLMVKPNLHALFHAINSGDYGTLKELLEQNLDINMTNEVGQTLLMRAIQVESVMMVRYLINHGANLYLMDDEHNMAIDYAKICKNRDVFNLVHYRILYEELTKKEL
jgi:ankyrin repeat protein